MDLTKAVDALCTLNIDNLSTEDAFVKWKNFQNQVLFQQDEYFYKVYEAPEFGLGPFNSMVRRALASAYEQLGIHWEVCSAESHGKTFDFEQRQQLRVATIEDFIVSNNLLPTHSPEFA